MIDPDKNLRIPPVTDCDGRFLRVDGKAVVWADAYNPDPLNKYLFTPYGGFAVSLTNRTGGASVAGEVVRASTSYDNAVSKIVKDQPDPIGAFYQDGIADGAEAYVVVSGIAYVYFVGNTTRGQLARGFLTADGASYAVGQAMAEAVPTSPFATDKHFYEIGHILESRTGAGLAKVILHFN